MDRDAFVQRVKMLCLQKGVKPTNVCIELGIGGSFLPDIKRGRIPSVEKVQKLAAYLGVTTSELLGEEKEPTPVAGSGPDPELWKLIQQIPDSRMPEVERYLRFQADQKEKP